MTLDKGDKGDKGEVGETGQMGGLTTSQFRALRTLGICILVLFVVGLGAIKLNNDSNQDDIKGTQRAIKDAQVAGCIRGQGERDDNRGLEKDVETFAASSVKFRKSQGQMKLAKESQGIVDRTKKRAKSRKARDVNCKSIVR